MPSRHVIARHTGWEPGLHQSEPGESVANRITVGLILAALIVVAAMLMRVETSWRILGYPGLAILFFLAAAGGGLWLTFQILLADHHTSKVARSQRTRVP